MWAIWVLVTSLDAVGYFCVMLDFILFFPLEKQKKNDEVTKRYNQVNVIIRGLFLISGKTCKNLDHVRGQSLALNIV